MWKSIGLEQCLSFINCQLRPADPAGLGQSVRPTITISRMTGSGGRTVASELVEYLQARSPAVCHWTVFDRNLIEKVLEDHHLPKRLAQFMPENHKPLLGDVLEEILGLHPDSWTLVHQTAETILRLAQMGCVILVGRGANIITAGLENAFHVRLIGSLPKRIERVQKVYDLDRPDALRFIDKEDRGRARYLKEHFGKKINDPLLYHLTINTDRIGYTEAARMVGEVVIQRFKLGRQELAA